MRSVIHFLFLLVIVSCDSSSASEKNQEGTSPDSEPLVEPKEFTVIDSSAFDMSKLSYEGEITTKRFWQDAKGENIVLFTGQEDLEKGEADIFVYQYVINEGTAELVKDLKASVKDCADADLFLDFDERAFSVSDLDQDNIGEITFAYRMACVTDVSPHSLELHLFEDGSDYALVGDTEVQVAPDERIGGQIRETHFDNASSSFLPKVKEIWEIIKMY